MKIEENEIKRICSPVIYKRGVDYYKEGRVHIKLRENNHIGAIVDGEELYNVRININNNKISDCFCTCPYYHTMGSNCKHIVAVLKKRQSELDEGESYKDENDRLAQMLCSEFSENCFDKQRLNVKLGINAHCDSHRECMFYITLSCGFDELKDIDAVDRFFECYLNRTDFKISKHHAINSSRYSLAENDEKIINILCEAYQNKACSQNYMPRISQTLIAPATAKRLFSMLGKADIYFTFNSMQISDIVILEENPDILIDINATDSEISLNVFESGISLFSDGSWFLYENCLYHTTKEWREWFMPIYNSLMSESRTQIDFKGSTRIDFATYVYPKLRNKQGVITTGIDSILINEKPEFSVFLDYKNKALSAVVKVSYGNIDIRLPNNILNGEKIVIRDKIAEDRVISFFSEFNLNNETYTLSDNDLIYKFIDRNIIELKKLARIYSSESFTELYIDDVTEIKAKVSYKKDVDLLEIGFDSALSSEEIYEILSAIREDKTYYKFDNGGFLPLTKDNISTFTLLETFGFGERDIKNRKKTISKYHLLYASALKNKNIISSDKAFDDLVNSIKNISVKIPSKLDKILRKYQKDSVLWMYQLCELGFGGILADDMGLGKTLEVIAFVMTKKHDKPALVVTPSTLTYNWQKEIEKFAPDAKVKLVVGTKEERSELIEDISGYDFIITSYPILRRDSDLFLNLEFSFMFIDESQHIKNPDTLSAKAVKRIKATNKFALSGTPVENRITELWSVFDYIMKGYLSTRKEFSRLYEVSTQSGVDVELLEDLRQKISPFILRRMKSDVLSELPEKIENTVFCGFEPAQQKMYEAFHAVAKKEIPYLFDNSSMQILTLLLRLRQICCHPALVDKAYLKDSGKLLRLCEIVESAISHGHRILIFSQFTSMLEIIRKKLTEMEYECFFIDGKTPAYLRTELSNRFNNGEKNIFLISLKAGGTGLNLTGADTVILYDPWWNPAVMEQAADRAYRIGQTKAVQVIKLATKGTIEEQILKLQQNKKNLADSLIKKNEKTISGLTREEILSLFE